MDLWVVLLHHRVWRHGLVALDRLHADTHVSHSLLVELLLIGRGGLLLWWRGRNVSSMLVRTLKWWWLGGCWACPCFTNALSRYNIAMLLGRRVRRAERWRFILPVRYHKEAGTTSNFKCLP